MESPIDRSRITATRDPSGTRSSTLLIGHYSSALFINAGFVDQHARNVIPHRI
jgi:hypothetical protein